MKYAEKLKKGDKVAIVSLSSGMLGEEFCSHNIEIGVKRLKEYGLLPVFMPNARKGITYLKAHPEARAQDLKDAFFDDSIRGIICAIGGAGALAAKCIKSLEVIAYEDLGCESVKRLQIEDFPVICAIDGKGGNLFQEGRKKYEKV